MQYILELSAKLVDSPLVRAIGIIAISGILVWLIGCGVIKLVRWCVHGDTQACRAAVSQCLRTSLIEYRGQADYTELCVDDVRALVCAQFRIPTYAADRLSEDYWYALTQVVECFFALGPSLQAHLCSGRLSGMMDENGAYEPTDSFIWLEFLVDLSFSSKVNKKRLEYWLIWVDRSDDENCPYYIRLGEKESLKSDFIDEEADLSYDYPAVYATYRQYLREFSDAGGVADASASE